MSRQIPQYLFEGGGTGAIKEVEKLFNLRGVNGKSSLTGDVKFAQKFARDYLESAPYDFSLLRPFLSFSLPILSLSLPPPPLSPIFLSSFWSNMSTKVSIEVYHLRNSFPHVII